VRTTGNCVQRRLRGLNAVKVSIPLPEWAGYAASATSIQFGDQTSTVFEVASHPKAEVSAESDSPLRCSLKLLLGVSDRFKSSPSKTYRGTPM
jgi:hypothetical protein